MALTAGSRVGAYEILSLLGTGGMGEVYRAKDHRLNRGVALKVLPSSVTADPERLARFEREAQVLASLNHPNIAAIYGVEDSGGTPALVMELVEGPTLADLIAKGPIPLDDAILIARQIVEALEAAHGHGIIHRDLKPSNIKVREDGTVKVLDFGLARGLEPLAGDTPITERSHSPTITAPALMTGVGVLLGTAAYMAPEQAKGRSADKRSDIWAFGCVLYEMLTGRRAFEGEDVADTLAAVLRGQLDSSALPGSVPAALRTLVQRCVERDPKRRLADISTARFVIDEYVALDGPGASRSAAEGGRQHRSSVRLPWAIAIATLAVPALVMIWASRQKADPPFPTRLTAQIGVEESLLVAQEDAAMALSPDGRVIAFVTLMADAVASTTPGGRNTRLYLRRLDELHATLVPNTEGARHPFFSPDGQWVGFFADQKLKKAPVRGAGVVTVCDAPADRGADWSPDGTIVFSHGSLTAGVVSTSGPIYRVASSGGTPQPLTSLVEGEVTHRWPQLLPGGNAILYTAHTGLSRFDGANVVVQQLTSGSRHVLVRGGFHARYLASGHLVYVKDGTLFAAPFDIDRLELAGEAVPIIEGLLAIGGSSNGISGGAQFTTAQNGTLAYISGSSADAPPLVWMDRQENTSPLLAVPGRWTDPHFSPDGRQLALTQTLDDGKQWHVWVYDLEHDRSAQLITNLEDDRLPAWTPDGRRITFTSGKNLFWQRVDGIGGVQRLTDTDKGHWYPSWHPNGRLLAFTEGPQLMSLNGQEDIVILSMDGDEAAGWKPGMPTPFLNSPAQEVYPAFSPDGSWLAYQSNVTGTPEVYVTAFPGKGGTWRVSSGGGWVPTWSRSRRELWYETPDNHLVSVAYSIDGESFRPEKPRIWSNRRFSVRPVGRDYDLHPDGERIAFAFADDPRQRYDTMTFVFGFFDELRRLAPRRRQ